MQGCYVAYGPNISLLDEAIKLKEKNLTKTIYDSNDFHDFINISDIDFLTTNKNKVLEILKNKDSDFKKISEIIYD